jgi:rhodanese-related sulfurtransferase
VPPADLPLDVACRAVRERLDAGEPLLLVDCREPHEHALAALPGARLVPMGQLAARLDELAPLRDAAIVVYCHHGLRSRSVVEFLRQRGFARAQSLAGGIDRWSVEIDPTLPRY